MSDYTKTTNFTAKDSLASGDANKRITGALFDTEFNALVTAVASKVDDGANSTLTSITGLTTPLSVGQGGTGSTTAAGARTNLSAAVSGINGDIAELTGLITPLSIAQGGTSGVNSSAARAALSAAALGANSDITSLTGLTTPLSLAQGGLASGTAAGGRATLGLGALATLDTVAAAQIDAGAVTMPKLEAGVVQGSYSGGAQTVANGTYINYLALIGDAASHIQYVYIPVGATDLKMVGRVLATVGGQQAPTVRVNVNGTDGSVGSGSAIDTYHVTAESSISVAALSGWVPMYVMFAAGANTSAILTSVSWRIT